jgi:hypothetical protein
VAERTSAHGRPPVADDGEKNEKLTIALAYQPFINHYERI